MTPAACEYGEPDYTTIESNRITTTLDDTRTQHYALALAIPVEEEDVAIRLEIIGDRVDDVPGNYGLFDMSCPEPVERLSNLPNARDRPARVHATSFWRTSTGVDAPVEATCDLSITALAAPAQPIEIEWHAAITAEHSLGDAFDADLTLSEVP